MLGLTMYVLFFLALGFAASVLVVGSLTASRLPTKRELDDMRNHYDPKRLHFSRAKKHSFHVANGTIIAAGFAFAYAPSFGEGEPLMSTFIIFAGALFGLIIGELQIATFG